MAQAPPKTKKKKNRALSMCFFFKKIFSFFAQNCGNGSLLFLFSSFISILSHSFTYFNPMLTTNAVLRIRIVLFPLILPLFSQNVPFLFLFCLLIVYLTCLPFYLISFADFSFFFILFAIFYYTFTFIIL
uniref:Uncharacterized protein n=1 Tax=Anopheles quadriannulatus TaxID=34691 RepID=A0A182XTL8_ANOQN